MIGSMSYGRGSAMTAMLPLHDRRAEIIRDLDRLKWMLVIDNLLLLAVRRLTRAGGCSKINAGAL
jgi:hypothetical protein